MTFWCSLWCSSCWPEDSRVESLTGEGFAVKHAAVWVAMAVTICTPLASAQTIQVDKNNRTIAITATDKASAPAEIAAVTVGFEIYAPDADGAYRQGSELSNAILTALKMAGVADESIQSNDQKLTHTEFPDNDESTAAQRAQKAFTLSQNWVVRVGADQAATVLHVAIGAGANEGGNIDWQVKDRNALEARAAAVALERARSIAAQMAAGLNAHLGALVYASNEAPAIDRFRGGLSETVTVSASLAGTVPNLAPLAIRPQQVEESATVYAVFAIE
jgi:uncharacterized protein